MIPLPLSNVFGKIIQVSQIEHRQPGIPRKFSNFRKFLNDSQLCKGKLPLLRCTFLNALTSQYRNFPYRPSFKLKLTALMADFVWPTAPTSSTDARAAMRWSVVCCLLLAACVSTCMDAPVRVERLDYRKNAPHRQICPGCGTTVSRGCIKRQWCPKDGFVDHRKRQTMYWFTALPAVV